MSYLKVSGGTGRDELYEERNSLLYDVSSSGSW
jgi:hypothetical protein